MLMWLHLPVCDCTNERIKSHSYLLVFMGTRRQGSNDSNGYTQFFKNLSTQAFGRILASFDLTAREFPLEWQAHGPAPLRGKDAIVALDNGAGDVKMICFQLSHSKEYPKYSR